MSGSRGHGAEFKPGDRVAWRTSQGETEGRIVERLTHPDSVKGHEAAASRAHPEYRVRSDKTGAEAIHRPDALRRL